NKSLRSLKKFNKDLLRTAFDKKELGKHPKAIYLNRSEPKVSNKKARDKYK
ncbi:hypothetical protein DL95DRAFT_317636, partial [Leptodontidium sp. 2 PMI_412]